MKTRVAKKPAAKGRTAKKRAAVKKTPAKRGSSAKKRVAAAKRVGKKARAAAGAKRKNGKKTGR